MNTSYAYVAPFNSNEMIKLAVFISLVKYDLHLCNHKSQINYRRMHTNPSNKHTAMYCENHVDLSLYSFIRCWSSLWNIPLNRGKSVLFMRIIISHTYIALYSETVTATNTDIVSRKLVYESKYPGHLKYISRPSKHYKILKSMNDVICKSSLLVFL